MPRIFALLVCVSLTLLGSGAPAAAQRSKSASLNSPYELFVVEGARLSGVSASGRAVGVRTVPGSSQALVWTPAGGAALLAPLAGFPNSTGVSANRDGFVLGISFTPAETFATLWSPGGTPLAIPDLGWSLTSPMALTDDGVVVGNGHMSSGWRPWIWDAVNGTRDLVGLGLPAYCTVADINSAGVIAASPSFGEAFLFDLGATTSTPLGTLGGDSSFVRALDEAGHAVGSSWTAASNDPSPFWWSPGTGMLSLGTPTGPGFVVGTAQALNDSDVVVGAFRVAPNHDHAFVWDAAHGLRDLNSLVHRRRGVELEAAYSISERGWIAGNAIDHAAPAGSQLVGFVLRPF